MSSLTGRGTTELDHTPVPLLKLPARVPAPSVRTVNRRTLPRVQGRFEVQPTEGGPCFEGLDLSFAGLMCKGRTPYWPGNELDFELDLEGDGEPLAISGRVVELVSHGGAIAMRLRFSNLCSNDRERIAVWMARQCST